MGGKCRYAAVGAIDRDSWSDRLAVDNTGAAARPGAESVPGPEQPTANDIRPANPAPGAVERAGAVAIVIPSMAFSHR